LRGKLDKLLEPEEDSVRLYHMCAACVAKTETIGSEKPAEERIFIV
jgi:CRISPR-associated protein Cas2